MAKSRALSIPRPAFGAPPQLEITDCGFKLGRLIMGGENGNIKKFSILSFFLTMSCPPSVLSLET